MAFDTVRDASMMRAVMKAEFLDAETELKLAYAWRDDRDEAALHRLITAYMRLAISMAVKFKRYGLKRGLLSRFGAKVMDDAMGSIEDRAAFARFGL